MTIVPARALIEGEAEGVIAAWSTPLSFWGGLDAATGCVIDRSHPAFGEVVSGRVLAMPSGRGSSSASSVLAEAIRRGTAPAAIVLAIPDAIIVVGAIVAEKLYGKTCPVLVCERVEFERLVEGSHAMVSARGDASTISMRGLA
jgi:predicted aconitase with swiveling domain